MLRPRAGRRAIATILLALNVLIFSLCAAFVTNVVLDASALASSVVEHPWSTASAFLVTTLILATFSIRHFEGDYGLISSALKIVLIMVSFSSGIMEDRGFVYALIMILFDFVSCVHIPVSIGPSKSQVLMAFAVFFLRTTLCRTDAAATTIGFAAGVGFVFVATPILTVIFAGREVMDMLIYCVGVAMLASFTAMKQVFGHEAVEEAHNKLGELTVATHSCSLTVSITTALVVVVMMPIVPRNEAAVLLPAMKKVAVASILVMLTVSVKVKLSV